MSEPQVIVFGTLGELVRAARRATDGTGFRVSSVDRVEAGQLAFRLLDESGATVREWRINRLSVMDRPRWGIDEEEVVEAMRGLIRYPATREILAEWFSRRLSLEEAVKRARPHVEGTRVIA